jgi:hypothetical protein
MAWMVSLTDRSEGKLVLQKMSSTLAIYYLLPKVHAEACVRVLLHSFATKSAPSDGSLAGPSEILPALDLSQLTVGFWFCKNLAEEANYKIVGYPPDIVASALSRMRSNLVDVISLIEYCLTVHKQQSSEALTKIRSEALSTLLTWALSVQKGWPNNEDVLSPLRLLIEPALFWCAREETSSDAMDVFSDLLTSFGTFFHKEHLDMISSLLTSSLDASHLEAIWAESNEIELHPLARLVLAFGDATVKTLAHHPDSPVTQRIMSKLFPWSRFKCCGLFMKDEIQLERSVRV